MKKLEIAVVVLSLLMAGAAGRADMSEAGIDALAPEEAIKYHKNRADSLQGQVKEIEQLKTELRTRDSSLKMLGELNEQQLKKQKDQQSQLDALTAKLESGEGAAAADTSKLQADLDAALAELKGVKAARSAADKAAKDASNTIKSLQKQVDQATRHQEKLAAQVQDAQAKQQAAEAKLAQQGLDSNKAKQLLEAAEKRAAEASSQFQDLYKKATSSWTPVWLQERFGKVSKHKGLGTAHQHLQAAWAKILVLWAKLKRTASHLHISAGPLAKKVSTTSQQYYKTARRSFKKHTKTLWRHKLVRQAKQRFWVMHANLETMLIKLLSKSKNPVIRRMTERPYSYSIVNFFLLMPVALLLPSLMAWCCSSGRRRPSRPVSKPSASSRGAGKKPASRREPPPQFPTPEARTKNEKGRRITLGGDTVRIP